MKNNKLIFIIPGVAIFVVAALIIIISLGKKKTEPVIESVEPITVVVPVPKTFPYEQTIEKIPFTDGDLAILSSENYEGLMLKMHNLKGFNDEYFTNFVGMNVALSEGTVSSAGEMLNALSKLRDDYNQSYSRVFLEIDPVDFYLSLGDNPIDVENALGSFIEFLESNPNTLYEILYAFPHVSYWSNLTEEDFEEVSGIYNYLTEKLSEAPNLLIFAPGSEEWLICNQKNYTDTFSVNSGVSYKLICHTFCDRHMIFSTDVVDEYFDKVKDVVKKYNQGRYNEPFPDNTRIVFFGDSILDFYRDSFGTPEVISSFTNSKTYNLGRGGMRAGGKENDPYSFASIAKALNTKTMNEKHSSRKMGFDYIKFLNETKAEDNIFFVVMFGVNDYLNYLDCYNPDDPSDIETTYGGLTYGINELKNAYPNSKIILASPYRLKVDYSLSVYGVKDEAYKTYFSYVNTIKKAAEDTGCYYLSLFDNSPVGDDTFDLMISTDGIHPTEEGELAVSKVLISYIKEIMIEEYHK